MSIVDLLWFLLQRCVFFLKFLPGGCFLVVMIDITLIFHDLIFFEMG